MHRRMLLPGLAAALALACATAAADTAVLDLDPQATRVSFHFGATFKGVRGSLAMREGQITLRPENGLAAGRIVLDLAGAQTGVARRDRKMREKILETSQYPVAIFYPERIDGQLHREGRSDIQIHGRLDFHGASHQIGIVGTATAHGDRVMANGFFTIPYISWGLRDPSFFVLRVAKEVQVEIQAVGRLVGGSLEPERPSPAAAGERAPGTAGRRLNRPR